MSSGGSMSRNARRIRSGTIAALLLAPLVPSSRTEIGAQVPAGVVADTSWTGQRIIMVQGMGAVHAVDTGPAPRTVVGINLVMPVRRVDGRKVWMVSTSGGDSGWVDIRTVRLLNGSV